MNRRECAAHKTSVMNLWHAPAVARSQCHLHSSPPWADGAMLRESCCACENPFTTGATIDPFHRNIGQTSVTAVSISSDFLRQIPTNVSQCKLQTVANLYGNIRDAAIIPHM